MKLLKLNFKLMLFWVSIFLLLTPSVSAAYDAGDNTFYLKTGDGHEEYTVDGTVTFKLTKSSFPSYRDAGVTFAPANPGELIQATVESIDLDSNTNYLLLYHGYVRTGYSGASNGIGQGSYMPVGWFAKIGASAAGNIYTSESEDGKLTFGFHSTGANGQTGFVITVTNLSPKEMEFVSAGAFRDVVSVNRGARNQILFGANVKMDGGGNPLSLNELKINTSALDANQVENVRLYASDNFTEANLLAGLSAFGENLTYSGNHALRNSDNKFYLVADIKPDASGTIPTISLSTVKVNNEAQTVTTATPENDLTVNNTILIGSDHLTYTIADPADFYDDGGKDGKISLNFDGIITFVPATPGKKIKIDFSKLEIFNTSSTGNNDLFKFYNGQNADESDLITTLLKEAKIIKSTADDGSLTITLKSITGVAANGWEAVVSEFVPGPMVFDALDVTPLATGQTLAGSSLNEQFLLLNIKTTNTLSPLALQSIVLDATGTSNLADLDKAKVYALGETSTFVTTTLFGETNVSDASVLINGNAELKEGNNYFAVVYDITSAASNGNIIASAVSNIVVSGETKTPGATTLSATRTVANIFKHLPGNHTREFHDTWTYTDTKSPYSSTYYNYEDADCLVTFTPTLPNAASEIDFSSFDVYYADSSYGTKAVFEVYSGNTTDADHLLWKLSSNAQSKTGPGKKLRSTAADGSITIKFNAKASSSYYAGTGWTASVTPFVNHDMTVEEIVVTQASTDNLKAGDTNEEIIRFAVETEGNLTTQIIKEVKLDLKSSLPVVNKVSVLYSGEEDDFSKSVLFGSLSDPNDTEITITGTRGLSEGLNYFWVSYDLKNVVDNDVEVDARLISVKTEDTTAYLPVDGDPAGHRLTKNEYLLGNGNNGEVVIYNPIQFYDDGGAAANYSASFDGQVTFLPSEPGKVIKLSFEDFNTSTSHYFYAYNGTEVDENKLIGRYSGTTIPASFYSASADGTITIRFTSGTGTIYNRGWDIRVESYSIQDLSVEKVETSLFTTADILRGSSKTAVQKIAITVAGDEGNLHLNNFKFTNTGTTDTSDITAAGLYFTGLSSGFLADNPFGNEVSASPYVFNASENLVIKAPGTYHFWLAYDIAAEADTGNKVAAQLIGININGTESSNISELSAAERTIKAGFKGDYIIGQSAEADYASFAEAISAMQNGVEGNVNFKVEAGNYTENIMIKAIQGTSESNRIRFTSLSGNNSDVIIKGSGYIAPPYGEQDYGMVTVDSTQYVTFENMSFIPTSQSYPYAVQIRHTSRYFTLRNCIITANSTGSATSGMSLFRMTSRNVDGQNNDYVTIENNSFYGGYIALYMGGTSFVALTKERGAVIRDNSITDAGSKGIYLTDEENALIENNTIFSSSTQRTNYIGIDIFRNRGTLIVRNNNIVNNQAYYSTGINLRQETRGSADQPALVYNNSIAITASPSVSSAGFDIPGDASYIHLYHNTLSINGTAGRGLYVRGSNTATTGMLFQNNLMQINTTGTASQMYFISNEKQRQGFTFKNNAYYFAGGTAFANNAIWGGSTFEDWISNAGETGSFVEQAQFVSATDLNLKEQGGFNAALPVSFITTDIEGKTRSTTAPTIGAYEYEVIEEVKPEMEESYPKTSNITYNSISISTKWNQSGSLYAMLLEADAEEPAEADLLALTPAGVNKGQEQTSTFNALQEMTGYKAYFLFISTLSVKSDIVPTEVITTSKQIFPLSVSLSETSAKITAGESHTIYPTVSGGVYPYTYIWKNSMRETISTDSVLTVSPLTAQQYQLTVTSSDNQKEVLYSDLIVLGESRIASFEDNYLAPESYWQGREDGDEDEYESLFYSGSYSFTNTFIPDWNTWGGFGYSNETSTNFQSLNDQFRSVAGHGAENSATYAVIYPFGARTDINVVNTDENVIIPGVYLTNAAYTYSSMTEGDSFNEPFKQGDWYKVILTGKNAGGITTTVEHYLADLRSENEADHYILTDWEWFDLSALGAVRSISISLDGSRKNDYGLTIPAYLCMDNLGSEEPIATSGKDQSLAIGVHPNPFTDYINVSAAQSGKLTVTDLSGRLWLNTNIQNGSNHIDTTALPKGVYILQVNGNSIKIIK